MAASRALRLAVFAFVTLTAGAASANGPALVVDAETGQVLHAERATDPWFPASITKLMTAYVALDQVRLGRASMDQLLSVSEDAAALPPSKMAFKPGTQIRLDNALKIIMVKSANDVAATIADNLGGSIEGFAGMMNDAAQKIGMRESHFVNPHGLPDDRQQTSARDMALLAKKLFEEFPEHEGLFNIGAIQFGRRVMRNHNGLIGRYPGSDGMKTGFICASGFNVVASAKRDGRRIITVVLGSQSANERTVKAADLFDRGFYSKAGSGGPTLDALPASVLQSPPNMRPVICDRRGPMPGEEDGPTAESAANAGAPNFFASSNVLAFAGGSIQPLQRTTLGPRAPVQPVRVWVGLNPPGEADLAKQAADEDAEQAKAVKGKTKSAARKTAPAVDSKPSIPEAAISEKGTTGRASLAVKPVTRTDAKAATDISKPDSSKPDTSKPELLKPAASKPAPPKAAPPKAAPVAAQPLQLQPAPKASVAPVKAEPPRKPAATKPEVKADAAPKPAAKVN